MTETLTNGVLNIMESGNCTAVVQCVLQGWRNNPIGEIHDRHDGGPDSMHNISGSPKHHWKQPLYKEPQEIKNKQKKCSASLKCWHENCKKRLKFVI